MAVINIDIITPKQSGGSFLPNDRLHKTSYTSTLQVSVSRVLNCRLPIALTNC